MGKSAAQLPQGGVGNSPSLYPEYSCLLYRCTLLHLQMYNSDIQIPKLRHGSIAGTITSLKRYRTNGTTTIPDIPFGSRSQLTRCQCILFPCCGRTWKSLRLRRVILGIFWGAQEWARVPWASPFQSPFSLTLCVVTLLLSLLHYTYELLPFLICEAANSSFRNWRNSFQRLRSRNSFSMDSDASHESPQEHNDIKIVPTQQYSIGPHDTLTMEPYPQQRLVRFQSGPFLRFEASSKPILTLSVVVAMAQEWTSHFRNVFRYCHPRVPGLQPRNRGLRRSRAEVRPLLFSPALLWCIDGVHVLTRSPLGLDLMGHLDFHRPG